MIVNGLLVVVVVANMVGNGWLLWKMFDNRSKVDGLVRELAKTLGEQLQNEVKLHSLASDLIRNNQELANKLAEAALGLSGPDSGGVGEGQTGMDRLGFTEAEQPDVGQVFSSNWGPSYLATLNPWSSGDPVTTTEAEDPGEVLEALDQLEGPNPAGYEEMLKREGWDEL